MNHRDNQFDLYAYLLRHGLSSLDVVWSATRPIAYRLDAHLGRTVMCLKWSYDEEYRRCSPGFYLLTKRLVQRWGDTDLDSIDLFGSPDRLKDLISTDRVARFDLAWPPGPAVDALRAERTGFDRQVRENHQAGRGVRQLYQTRDQGVRGTGQSVSGPAPVGGSVRAYVRRPDGQRRECH
jgi:CelD/BcsL family acetyltransferase involved in cellulose biosynthesis